MKFLIVPGLSRSCIIWINILGNLKSSNNFCNRKIVSKGLEGRPSLKIIIEDEDITQIIQEDSSTKKRRKRTPN